jgi:hypothetical protein
MLTELTHLSKISQDLLSSAAAVATMVAMTELSSSSPRGSPCLRRPILEPPNGCPIGMCLEPSVPHIIFAPPIFVPELNV